MAPDDPRRKPLIHQGRVFINRGARAFDTSLGDVHEVLVINRVEMDGTIILHVYESDCTPVLVADPRAKDGSRLHHTIHVPIERVQVLLDNRVWDLDFDGLVSDPFALT